ncbi:hypothetical protein [Bradyrhizobium viridifuturi]|uniref:hypothetical protein n=1 Tax=Bradyrhizobium viridifuturi TaxID=1654716 RepID=UPI00067F2878|nr:hypothetical protein [Bradyrhizobium viridifuturi]
MARIVSVEPLEPSSSRLRAPRVAAAAGVLFSLLLLAVFWLMRRSVPADPLEPGAWLASGTATVALALNLVPFAGVAFLWFVGFLRERLGAQEDQFFATLFLGSAVLLLAMLFTAAAVIGAIILSFHAAPDVLINSATFHFGRGLAYGMVNIYLVKTSSVFMITTSTIALYTGLTSRWLAYGGYAVAGLLLLGSYYIDWSLVVFPIWVLLVSISIWIDPGTKPTSRRASG